MDDFWKSLTVIVALLAVWIAYRNFAVSRERFRLDLFDKRFKVFEAARHLVSQALNAGELKRSELWAFRAAVIEKEFLFGDAIVEYLNEMDRHAERVYTLGIALQPLQVDAADPAQAAERQRNQKQFMESIDWVAEQIRQLHTRFAPEMRIRSRGLL